MDNLASWIATVATIFAACLTASNLGSRITGYGFIVFTIGSVAWLVVGYRDGQPALVWTNVVMTLLNLFGVWRWLGRQAKLEDGARAASKASAVSPGEKLFPVSLLSSAKAVLRDGEAGACVDGMAGCGTGRLAYLVVSEGGVAGVGETFRRVPWALASVQDDEVRIDCDRARFRALDQIDREEWPGQ